MIGLFVLLLTAYACNSAEHLLECFFKENLAEIQNASDIQKDSNKKMIIVAENISKHFGEAMDMLDGLQESINVSHSSSGNCRQHRKHSGSDPETGGYVF